MKILIVGGAGYLGGGITDCFMETNHELIVYDVLLYEEYYRKKIPFVFGDIRDHDRLKEYLNWAEAVVWLAAIVGDPACALNEELTYEINTNSVKFLKENFNGRIIFISTCSVYGLGENVLSEESEVNPLSLYAKTKLESEKILEGTNSLCFRLGTLFGLSDEFSRIRFDLVVNTLVMRAIFHGKFTVFGGEQYRPLLHVCDIPPAVALAIDSKETGIFNLSYKNYKICDIANIIKKYFPDLLIELTGEQFQDNRNYSVSSDKAKELLGFNPVISLEDGIQEMKELLEDKRIKNTFISRFSNYDYLRQLMSDYPSPLGKEIKLNL